MSCQSWPGRRVMSALLGGLLLLVALRQAGAQVPINVELNLTGAIDFSGAVRTAPFKTGTLAARPVTCLADKEHYVVTDASPAEESLYRCNSAGNAWHLVGGGGGGGGVALGDSPTWTGAHTFAQTAATGNPALGFTFTGAPHTALTAAEHSDIFLDTGRTIQYASNPTIALSRVVRWGQRTESFATAGGIITDAVTNSIGGPPTAGTNATITRGYTQWLRPGTAGTGTVNAYGLRVDAPTDAQSADAGWFTSTVALSAIAAPATPGAGLGRVYLDSTSKNLAVKDDAGVVKHGVRTNTGAANEFLTAIAADGTVSRSLLPALNTLPTGLTGSRCVETTAGGLLTVAAGACGTTGGSVTISGTPSNGQTAEWTSATAIQGVATTGTGSYVKGTRPTLTVQDSTFTIQDNGDNTKQLQIMAGAIATATTRTATFPNANITVAGVDLANSWGDGIKQTFNPNATTAGLNVGSQAGDPSTPANGDLWYDSTANELTARINGANVALGAGGAGVTDGDKTDITVSGSGATWTIDTDVVTYAKMQNVTAASRLVGRGSDAGAGDPQELTIGSGLAISGTVLSSTVSSATDPTMTQLSVNQGTAAAPNGTTAGVTVYYRYDVIGALTIPAPTGSPADGKEMRFLVKSAIPQDLTFTSGAGGFDADAGLTLPSTTTGGNLFDYFTFRYNGNVSQWLLVASTQATAPLGVTGGGTGVATLTPHGVLIGHGTTGVTSVPPTANSQCLLSHATDYANNDPVWGTCTGGGGAVDISGTPVAGQLATWTDANTIAGLTGTATLPQAADIVLCNTADCTTNYERGRVHWSSNVLSLRAESGGTGTIRQAQLISPQGGIITTNGGVAILGNAGGQATLASNNADTGLRFRGTEGNDVGAVNIIFESSMTMQPISGLSLGTRTNHVFAPTSGTAEFAGLTVADTVNQTTVTGSPITRGLYINPTLTSALDYRSIAFNGQYSHSMRVDRHPTANTAGSALTVRAGGATAAATDKDGGRLILTPGMPTGTGRAWVETHCWTSAVATGTGDGTEYLCGVSKVQKVLTDNSAANVLQLALATNSANSVVLTYQVEVVTDANAIQVERGRVECSAINQAGTVSQNTCTEITTQGLGSGTLATTWALSAANPAQLTLTADTSLTLGAGRIVLSYGAEVLGTQAITIN